MNEGWVADFDNTDEPKYSIERYKSIINKKCNCWSFNPLSFKTRELRDFSFDKHLDLWKQLYQL